MSPTGLDKEPQPFYNLVREAHAAQDLAVLIVTHDLAALDALACRVIEVADHKATELLVEVTGHNHCAVHGAHCDLDSHHVHDHNRGRIG